MGVHLAMVRYAAGNRRARIQVEPEPAESGSASKGARSSASLRASVSILSKRVG